MLWIGVLIIAFGVLFFMHRQTTAAPMPSGPGGDSGPRGEYGTLLLPPSMHPHIMETNYMNVSTWSSGTIGLSPYKVAADGQIVDRAAYSTIVGDGPSLMAGIPVVLLAELLNPTFRAFYKGTATLAYSPTPQPEEHHWYDDIGSKVQQATEVVQIAAPIIAAL